MTPPLPTLPLPTPYVPVSWGEVIDKLTILRTKLARIGDPAKRANVAREEAALVPIVAPALARSGVMPLVAELTGINSALWDIEDAIRALDVKSDFGEGFVALARAVYATNDRRAAVKRALNDLLGSELVEEKSYAATASFNDSSVAPHAPTASRESDAGSTAKR